MRTPMLALAICTISGLSGCGFRTPASHTESRASNAFWMDGQKAWFHDEGDAGGYFHTYDDLRIGSADNGARKIHVFLPREYEETSARYPVVYMNDGHTAFFPGGVNNKSWNTAKTLGDLYEQNLLAKVIVVAIHPRDRDFDYTHEQVEPNRPYGGLARYAKYVASDLKPWIDVHYRTQAARETTAVVGSSHGGLAAFYTASVYHRQFGFAGCLSSSFWVGVDTVPRLFGSLRDSTLLEAAGPGLANAAHPRFWLDWGLVREGGWNNTWVEALATQRGREMADLLVSDFRYNRNQDLFVMEDPQGDHSEDSWGRRLPLLLQKFAPTQR